MSPIQTPPQCLIACMAETIPDTDAEFTEADEPSWLVPSDCSVGTGRSSQVGSVAVGINTLPPSQPGNSLRLVSSAAALKAATGKVASCSSRRRGDRAGTGSSDARCVQSLRDCSQHFAARPTVLSTITDAVLHTTSVANESHDDSLCAQQMQPTVSRARCLSSSPSSTDCGAICSYRLRSSDKRR